MIILKKLIFLIQYILIHFLGGCFSLSKQNHKKIVDFNLFQQKKKKKTLL